MEPSSEDNTAVIRMKRDFNSFLSGTSGRKPAGVLSFDQGGSFLGDDSISGRRDRTISASSTKSTSMQQIFEKEAESKLKEVEMIRAKTYITQLESRVDSLETSRKRARVDYERECEMLKQEAEREKEKMSSLRHQFNQLGAKEQEARGTIADLREELLNTKQRLESRVLQLQKDKTATESRLSEENQQQRQRASELKREVLRQQADLQIANTELQEAQEQLSLALKRCADAKEQAAALEEKGLEALNAEIRIKDLETELERRETEAAVTAALKGKLVRFKELEQENTRLKEQNNYYKEMQDNVALLREQTESMRRKLERSEQKVASRLPELEVENEELKRQLERWSGGGGSPSQVASRISGLQSTNALLLEKQGLLQAQVHSLEAAAGVARQEIAGLADRLNKEQTKSEQLANYVKRAQRKILLVTKERDSYKSIIETYEAETTLSLGGGGSDAASRLRKTEEVLASYRQQTEEQEKELNARTEQISRLKEHIRQLEREKGSAPQEAPAPGTAETDAKIVLQLRETIAGLERDLERLGAEKQAVEDRLERRHLQGDYDPARTKVIHFRQNPLASAQAERAAELTKLREENTKLRARVDVLEAGGAGAVDVTLQVQQKLASDPAASEDVQGMKKELDKAETKNKRLMEAFKRTSQEVREVCYQLLGYRLDIPCQNQYKLMSMYADSPDDYFLFKLSGSEGTMQLLGTDFSEQPAIAERIATYLGEGNSIPAFLSAVTIDLFNSQTMMQTA